MALSKLRTFVCGTAALAIVCALPAHADASPGQAEPRFGFFMNGTVILPDQGPADFVVKVLRQSDGKIVTVATARTAAGAPGLVVSRFLSNGYIDTTFFGGGRYIQFFPTEVTVNDAALQPDGKIVIVGSMGHIGDFFVLRLHARGSVDKSVLTDFGADSFDEAFAVAIAPGGKIVVAGRAGQDVALARYTSALAVDTTFDGNGILKHDFGGQSEAEDVVVLADQRIVVSGRESTAHGTPRVVLARFAANGALDTTFGTAGRVNPASTPMVSTNALLAQGTKLLITGSINTSTSGITRYAANGTVDSTFGSAGTQRVEVGKFSLLRDLIADGSGRLVAVGQAANLDNFPDAHTFVTVFRFSANGAPDATFGCGGRVSTEVLGNGTVNYDAAGGASAVADGNDILVGGFAVTFNRTDLPPTDALLARYDGDGPLKTGYGLLRGDGGSSAFGGAPACGSLVGLPLNAPVVGMAYDRTAPASGRPGGSWTVTSDGGVFAFGAARFLGSMGGTHLNQPIVGMAATPDGQGYWLVARDGGIFAFGTARFFGSMGGTRLNQPIVGMAAEQHGNGYWLVARDGGIFAFGNARFSGSTGAMHLNQPIVGMAADPDNTGYWLVARDGGVFAFAARFSGSSAGAAPNPIVGIAADPDGTGYWIGASNGGIFAFDAPFFGSTGATPFPVGSARTTIGIAGLPEVLLPG